MIVYSGSGLFDGSKRLTKRRMSDKNKRHYMKRYRRLWWWYEEKWNQRHGITKDKLWQ